MALTSFFLFEQVTEFRVILRFLYTNSYVGFTKLLCLEPDQDKYHLIKAANHYHNEPNSLYNTNI
jgi:hypothetical protein